MITKIFVALISTAACGIPSWTYLGLLDQSAFILVLSAIPLIPFQLGLLVIWVLIMLEVTGWLPQSSFD